MVSSLVTSIAVKGVIYGDPLSLLLFRLVEEVICRSLTKLVREGELKLMHGTRELHIPSYILYVDDMMIFCKGITSNINVPKNYFWSMLRLMANLSILINHQSMKAPSLIID